MANIEIDGKQVQAELGMMIIEAADANDIWIPRFCYHKKLSIAANCRMCLVHVEKSGKPLAACATPITDGMKIWTKSSQAVQAQKNTMEFLLINHPLDCPICDQGGECELQDISMGYGNDVSRFTEKKRVVADEDLGPLIATDMTRCIQCTRCVRFGTEVAGIRELGALGRGEHMEIGTFIEKNVESEVSGNVIDLCPVGALTSKPFRFRARAWELSQAPSIAAHDCLGSNIYVQSRRNQVMRVVPKENEAINEVWISDRDRYSYEGLYRERLSSPKIKQAGKFQTVTWTQALNYVADNLKKVMHEAGPQNIAALLSPNSTTEEAYLLQKWLRGMGSNNIDHRLRQRDFQNQALTPLLPGLNQSLAELESQSLVVLLGSLVREEQPVLALKLRKITQNSGKIMVMNPIDCKFNFEVQHKIILPAIDWVLGFAKIAKALLIETNDRSSLPQAAKDYLEKIPNPNEADFKMAKAIKENKKTTILFGALALNHPEASSLKALAYLIRHMTGAKLGFLTEGANAAGLCWAGAVPHRLPGGQALNEESSKHRPGLNAEEIWLKNLKAYILLGLEPALDCGIPEIAETALSKADFVVAITPFESDHLSEVADVLLPSTPFTETSGTFINTSGIWQSFQAVAAPYQESRPAWKILRVLGNLWGLSGFDYQHRDEVLAELKQHAGKEDEISLDQWDWKSLQHQPRHTANTVIRIAPLPLYAGDNLVRRSQPLQKTHAAGPCAVYINAKTAENLGLAKATQVAVSADSHQPGKGNPQSVILPLMIDPYVADHSAMIPAGHLVEKTLPPPYAAIKLKPVEDAHA